MSAEQLEGIALNIKAAFSPTIYLGDGVKQAITIPEALMEQSIQINRVADALEDIAAYLSDREG